MGPAHVVVEPEGAFIFVLAAVKDRKMPFGLVTALAAQRGTALGHDTVNDLLDLCPCLCQQTKADLSLRMVIGAMHQLKQLFIAAEPIHLPQEVESRGTGNGGHARLTDQFRLSRFDVGLEG